MYILILLFGLMKLERLLTRNNPTINTFWTHIDNSVKFGFKENDFIMAFATEDTSG